MSKTFMVTSIYGEQIVGADTFADASAVYQIIQWGKDRQVPKGEDVIVYNPLSKRTKIFKA